LGFGGGGVLGGVVTGTLGGEFDWGSEREGRHAER
jgi:hypothetical protein